jgi:ssRNA-specific RNase YbeY (16S rRNA maturation enzyme)
VAADNLRTGLPARFKNIKESVLGKRYDLSLAFLTPAKMRAVTVRTKKKDHVSNVLSFPLSKNSGEILICKAAAKPFSLPYLFIHGLLHLKGFKHGATMTNQERRVLARYALSMYENDNRSGHRHLPSQSRHRAKKR